MICAVMTVSVCRILSEIMQTGIMKKKTDIDIKGDKK